MIKVRDLAYVRYQVTDLDLIRQFLIDFGLEVSYETENELGFSTANGNPYAYIAAGGNTNEFLGFGLEARDARDLLSLVDAGLATSVDPLPEQHGGSRATVRHPDGHQIDIVYGRAWGRKAVVREPLVHNFGTVKQRINDSQRPPKGSVQALRLGHVAITVSDVKASERWFGEHFGLRAADFLVTADEEQRTVGVFMSCDPADSFCDHHSVFITQSDEVKVHHCAFEVQDIDAVMSGHDFLIGKGYSLEVGVGRHMAGSQVFDYWIDPFGHRIEHYGDGDVVDSKHTPSRIVGTPEGVTQWGPIPPDKFFE